MSNYIIYNRVTGEVEGSVFTTDGQLLRQRSDKKFGYLRSEGAVNPCEYMVVEEVDEEGNRQRKIVKQRNERVSQLTERIQNATARATREIKPVRDNRTEADPDRTYAEPDPGIAE